MKKISLILLPMVWLVLKCWGFAPLHAQSDTLDLEEVVITAQYSPKRAGESIHKVKVISRERIEAQGAVTLQEVLQFETNIRLSQDNVLGSSVNVQGIGGQNVKVLVDGVPMVGRQNGNLDLSQINLNNVERIEIVEGPLSVNYGSDALAGTINLITKKTSSGKRNLRLQTYYESVGQYNLNGAIGGKVAKTQLQLEGGRNYFDGWSASDPFMQFPKSRLADSLRAKSWNPKEQYFGKFQLTRQIKGFAVRPYTEFFQEMILNRGLPRGPYGETAFDDRYRTRRWNGGLDVNGQLNDQWRLSLIGAYNHYHRVKNTYFKDLTTLESSLSPNASDQDTTQFKVWMSRGNVSSLREDARFNVQIGYDIQHETATGQRIETGSQVQGDYAAFASAEIVPVENVLIRPALRYGYNTAYQAPLVPSLNASYQLKAVKLRGAYARGFRAPSLKELYFDFVDINHNIFGNQDLKAEYSHNLNLSADWAHTQTLNLVSLSGSIYYNHIQNLITLTQLPGVAAFSYANIGEYKTLGLQASGELLRENLRVSIGTAYIGRNTLISESAITSTFNFSPEIVGQCRYSFPTWGGQVALYYKYTGPLPGFYDDGTGELIETKVEGYHTLDLTASKELWKQRVKWMVGAKNLLNVQNINTAAGSGGVHTGSGTQPVSWGRSLFTSFTFNFE